MSVPVDNNELLSIVQRIERLEAEKGEITEDIRSVYGEAKANGYDVKVLRKAVALRRRDSNERAEEEAILDLYMQALGELADTPLGRAAAIGFSSQPAKAREATYPERVSRPVDYQPTHIPPERDPQSGQHGSDSGGGAGGESRSFLPGSGQESAVDTQARNEPGSEGAASGGGGVKPAPETRFIMKPYVLRPHCKRPESCGGYGAKHCFQCQPRAGTEAA